MEHSIIIYENNELKEESPASKFPENMRYRYVESKQENGEIVDIKVPVAKIEVIFWGADGKLTTPDKAIKILITDYDSAGNVLNRNTMIKK